MVRILLVPALTPLYLCVSTFRSMCAVPSLAVVIIIISPISPLCRVSTLIFLRQTVSLGNTVMQLFWCYYS